MVNTKSNVKGSKISSKIAFVRDTYGEEMVAKLMKTMDPGDQEALRRVLDIGWYPIELYERVMRAICKTVAGGNEAIYEKIGRHSAEQVLTTTYRIFRGKDPVDVLKKMVPMHSMMNDPGDMQVISEREGHCVVKVLKPRSMPTICKVARSFYQRSVELCGGSSVLVKEPRCSAKNDPYCQFEITWQIKK